MFTKLILPSVAILGLAFAIFGVVQMQKPTPPSRPLVEPPKRPFRAIAGAGVVEAQKRNVPVGTRVAGVVQEVFVKEGDVVAEGQKLFRIEDRDLQAQLLVERAFVASMQAELDRLMAGYRIEDREIAKSAYDAAAARFQSADVAFRRTASVFDRGVGTQMDYDRDRFARDEAQAAMNKSETEWKKLENGSWIKDIEVARAAVNRAQAEVDRTLIEIDRHTVYAPAAGTVLQVNVLPGQLAALAWKEPLIVLGNTDKLHVRVDIDEQDLPLFKAGAHAIATLKGRPGVRFELTFVRVDPYVIPKKNLTGDNVERVDTRVLQVIYALPDKRPLDVYVGQQMDVYLESAQPKDLDLEANSDKPRPFEG